MGKCWRGRQQLEANCLTTFLRGAKELFGLRSHGIVVRVVASGERGPGFEHKSFQVIFSPWLKDGR